MILTIAPRMMIDQFAKMGLTLTPGRRFESEQDAAKSEKLQSALHRFYPFLLRRCATEHLGRVWDQEAQGLSKPYLWNIHRLSGRHAARDEDEIVAQRGETTRR